MRAICHDSCYIRLPISSHKLARLTWSRCKLLMKGGVSINLAVCVPGFESKAWLSECGLEHFEVMRKYRPVWTLVKIKVKGHAFKAYGGSGDIAAFIPNLGIRWGELSASRHVRFDPEENPRTHWVRGWMAQSWSGKGNRTTITQSSNPWPGHYTHWATAVPDCRCSWIKLNWTPWP
jgi:hypothetical protein